MIMRVEATYCPSSDKSSVILPVVIVMLKQQETCWRAHRFKIIGGFFLSLIVMQYSFGASVYHFSLFDRNQNYVIYMPNRLTSWWHNSTAANASTLVPKKAQYNITKHSKSVNQSDNNVSGNSGASTQVVKTLSTNASTNEDGKVAEKKEISSTEATKKVVKQVTVIVTNTTPAHPVNSSSSSADTVAMLGQSSDLPLCPVVPPVLVGPIRVWFDYPSFEELEKLYPYLEKGGHGKPKECVARHRVAIIIPYRDREKHLRGFLHNMHSLLTKQQLDYVIFIVDQIPNQTFNRAKLMNVGFVEAGKLYDFQCYVFHDVDLYPQDDRNIYSCPEQPRHMSVAVDKFKYKLPYTDIFGGITALTKEQFQKVNGFSNVYWGWGGEDDDMATRVKVNGFHISRYPANIAKYMMIKHTTEKENPVNKCRFKLLYKAKQRWQKDGLNTLKYSVEKLDLNPLYTRILVDLKETEGKEDLKKLKIC